MTTTDLVTEEWLGEEKRTWGDGPWLTEPDRAEWYDPLSQLACLALRNSRSGNWCGYVAVPPGHPLHGKDCDSCDVNVHGGLTFAGECMPHVETGGNRERREVVCHVPRPGEPDDVWWLGFDCHHGWDYAPGMEAHLREAGLVDPKIAELNERIAAFDREHTSYKTLDYVRQECTLLALQVYAVGPQPRPWKIAR